MLFPEVVQRLWRHADVVLHVAQQFRPHAHIDLAHQWQQLEREVEWVVKDGLTITM